MARTKFNSKKKKQSKNKKQENIQNGTFGNFVQIYDFLFEYSDINLEEKYLICEIYRLCKNSEKGCYANTNYFAKRLNCSERKIFRLLNELENKGWIARTSYGNERFTFSKLEFKYKMYLEEKKNRSSDRDVMHDKPKNDNSDCQSCHTDHDSAVTSYLYRTDYRTNKRKNKKKKKFLSGKIAKSKRRKFKKRVKLPPEKKNGLKVTNTNLPFKFNKKISMDKLESFYGSEFYLTKDLKQYAKTKGFCGDLDDFCENFIDGCKSSDRKYKDFHAAFKTWVRNEIKWHPDKHKKLSFQKNYDAKRKVKKPDVMNTT